MSYMTILFYVTFIVSIICALILFVRFLFFLYEEEPFFTLVIIFVIAAMLLASWVIYSDYPNLFVPFDNMIEKGN